MDDTAQKAPVGELIRQWRQRRRMSQLDLASEADVSQRHLSFVESGRASPSREMVLRLADRMEVPLRQRNSLLLAAGFAPQFDERQITDRTFAPALDAVRRVLDGHRPCPAIAVDRHWNMIMANSAAAPWLDGIAEPSLLEPPVNVLRLSLHPGGLQQRIVNFGEWRAHLLHRLRQQVAASGDATLAALEEELSRLPAMSGAGARPIDIRTAPELAVPLRVRASGRILSFISTVTVFGTPLDVTLSELAIESFFPADEETAAILRDIAADAA